MKKNYVKPMIASEKFAPDEYVSTCFYIACSYAPGVGPAGSNLPWGSSPYHSKDNDDTGCGHATNQAISVLSGDINSETGATISITELNVKIGGNYEGERQCYFVGTEGATSPRSTTISGVNAGETIYWVTDVGYWMPHKGVVQYSDSNRPNHS